MIVAIPYHNGDLSLMQRWASRVKQLGPYMNHEIIISPVRGVTTDDVYKPLANAFRKVTVLKADHTESGWPISCNRAFQNIAWHVSLNIRQPFLFMEPDAIPLCEGWLDSIEEEYQKFGSPFMGDFVDLKSAVQDGINHMSGVAVYHWNLAIHAPRIFNCYNDTGEYAWDIWAASEILPKMRQTNLIQHDWTGTGEKPHQWRKNNVDPSFVRPGAVIYHPDKRGVLLNDGLAGEGTRVEGEPRTGAVEGNVLPSVPASSFEHSSPAPLPTTTEEEMLSVKALVGGLKIHYEDKKLRKTVIEELANAGFIKAKKRKYTRKKVQASVASRKGTGTGAGISVSSDSQVES